MIGLAVGLVCSVGTARLMRSMLFGVQTWDAMTLGCVAGLLAFASLAAAFLPARRAASVDPVEALRAGISRLMRHVQHRTTGVHRIINQTAVVPMAPCSEQLNPVQSSTTAKIRDRRNSHQTLRSPMWGLSREFGMPRLPV